ncbi:MAG: hypothetical protein V2A79_18870 [Planctomycetota bacterium]
MNADEARNLLVDYLGGELDRAQTERFEAYLVSDPALAAEVEGLRRTLAAMRSLDEPAGARSAQHAVPATRRRGLPVLLRYAALIVFAFGGGYLTHEVTSGAGDGAQPAMVRPGRDGAGAASEWETRMAVAYVDQPGRSGLARSLIALARATSRP